MIDRVVDHTEAREALHDLMSDNNISDAYDVMQRYIEQQYRFGRHCNPPISFYTKKLDEAINMAQLLLKSGRYEVLMYPEDDAYVVNGNYLNLNEWPRYRLEDWE